MPSSFVEPLTWHGRTTTPSDRTRSPFAGEAAAAEDEGKGDRAGQGVRVVLPKCRCCRHASLSIKHGACPSHSCSRKSTPAIFEVQWAGSGGPKGAQVISELVDWEVRAAAAPDAADDRSCIMMSLQLPLPWHHPYPPTRPAFAVLYAALCSCAKPNHTESTASSRYISAVGAEP